MSKKHIKIPIRRPGEPRLPVEIVEEIPVEATAPIIESVPDDTPTTAPPVSTEEVTGVDDPMADAATSTSTESSSITEEEIMSLFGRKKRARRAAEEAAWRERAVRLQAEMENFRRRQQNLTETRVMQEKIALLSQLLPILDNLHLTLANLSAEDAARPGVQAAYDALWAVLRVQDVEPIPTLGHPFDPAWHEAVAMLPADDDQEQDLRIIEEQRPGYRLGDQLLRPAQVIVAKKG